MLKAGAKPKRMQQPEREWGGAVSGKLGQQTENGFQVIDAGIKIFEKKPKEPKAEVTPLSPEAAPIL